MINIKQSEVILNWWQGLADWYNWNQEVQFAPIIPAEDTTHCKLYRMDLYEMTRRYIENPIARILECIRINRWIWWSRNQEQVKVIEKFRALATLTHINNKDDNDDIKTVDYRIIIHHHFIIPPHAVIDSIIRSHYWSKWVLVSTLTDDDN